MLLSIPDVSEIYISDRVMRNRAESEADHE